MADSSRSSAAIRRRPTTCPGSNSTNISTSLSARKCFPNADPNTESRRIRFFRQNAESESFGISIAILLFISTIRNCIEFTLNKTERQAFTPGSGVGFSPAASKALTHVDRGGGRQAPATRDGVRRPFFCDLPRPQDVFGDDLSAESAIAANEAPAPARTPRRGWTRGAG